MTLSSKAAGSLSATTSPVVLRTAQPQEFEHVASFYRSNDYLPQIDPDDLFVVAEREGAVCGVVRLCEEHGVLLLRGMRVARAAQRQGIGTQLLGAAAERVDSRECYCVPHRHLDRFYAQIGFEEIEPGRAPPFLEQRWKEYRRDYGLDVIIMRRPPG